MTAPPLQADDMAASPPDDEATCRQAAKRLREKYPRWVVIWVGRTACYHAYPLASSRAGARLTDTTPVGLADKIEQAERAGASRRARPQQAPGTTTSRP